MDGLPVDRRFLLKLRHRDWIVPEKQLQILRPLHSVPGPPNDNTVGGGGSAIALLVCCLRPGAVCPEVDRDLRLWTSW